MTDALRKAKAAEKKRCRHVTSWVIFGGYGEWCWGCGAYRRLSGPEGECAVVSDWAYPGDVNPYSRFAASIKRRAVRLTERAKEGR